MIWIKENIWTVIIGIMIIGFFAYAFFSHDSTKSVDRETTELMELENRAESDYSGEVEDWPK